MTPLEREWERQRRALLRRQRLIDRDLVLSYRQTHRRIQRELEGFKQRLATERLLGKPITQAKLGRLRHFETLLADIERETWSWSRQATEVIAKGQRDSLALVNDHSLALVEASLNPATRKAAQAFAQVTTDFGRIDHRAVRSLVGFASDGRPLAELLESIAPHAKKRAKQELIYGLSRGQNPKEVARAFRKITDVPLDRAMNISRTEILRAYRSAAIESYQLNPDVVKGWTWMAQLSTRTCSACWAMHGTEFELDDPFDSHPRCRCSPVPRTATWSDLGFDDIDDRDRALTSGPDRFANLTPAEQRQILGPGKYDLYREGVPFEKFASHSHSKKWGGMYREATLAEARAAA